jgi:hypothetical protein
VKKKKGFDQLERYHQFLDVTSALVTLYNAKNTKYGDSFYRTNKNFRECFFSSLKRKYDRLDVMASSFNHSKTNPSERANLEAISELADLANYSIMTIMKLMPTVFKSPKKLWVYLEKGL